MRRGVGMFLLALALGACLFIFLGNAPAPMGETEAQLLAEAQRQEALYAALRARQEELEGRLTQLEAEAAAKDAQVAAFAPRLEEARAQAGLREITGPGVEVVLNDAPPEQLASGEDAALYIVHDIDVLHVVNALKAAGAQGITVNNVRLQSTTKIFCGGPTIRVRDTPLVPPFSIRAVGDVDKLMAAVTDGEGNPAALLNFYGIQFNIRRVEEMTLTRSMSRPRFLYARAVE